VFRFKEKIDIRRMIDIKEILSLESLSVQFFFKKANDYSTITKGTCNISTLNSGNLFALHALRREILSTFL
jgi:hypothetical protein